jgi:hypothetical protein
VQNLGVRRRIRADRVLRSSGLARTYAPQRYFALHARAAGEWSARSLVLKLFPPCAPRIGDSDDLAKISLKFSLKAIGANC